MELDVISKQCSDLLTSEPIPETTKEIFTDEEVARLWENKNLMWVDSVLFFLYTGFRISEMLDLKISNIDLEAGTMQGGTKTAAGKNRIVPIHSKIQSIVQHRIEQSKSGYLFEFKSLFNISARADHAADFSPNDGNFSQEYCMYFKKNCLSVAEKMQVRCAWRDTKQALMVKR